MKLVALKRDEIIRKLKKLGFTTVSSRKHLKMIKGNNVVVISGQHKSDVSPDMLSTILKQGNIDRNQWLSI